MRKSIVFMLIALLMIASTVHGYEVTVDNCGKKVTFDKVPERVIVHDINMTEMALALGLNDKMVGVTGITGWYKTSDEFNKKLGNIPELAPKYPNMENLIQAKPDLFIAGWYYGMKPGGEVTPDTLAPYGVKTLILTESCIHKDKNRPAADMNLLYDDILRLGKVFNKQDKAEKLVAEWKNKINSIADIRAKNSGTKVFLFDSGKEKPFTAGKHAIVTAMIEAAGGVNILSDMKTSWGRGSWEVVASRNPEFLILLDYQNGGGAKDLMAFLKKHPAMRETSAVKNERYIPLRYEELTPGPANIEAIIKIANAIYKTGDK